MAPDDVPNHQVGLVSREEFERLVQAGAFLEYSREGFSEREPDESTKAHPASASDSSSARSLLAQCPPLRPPDPTSASGVPLEPAGVTFDAIDLVIASGRVPVLALRPQVPISHYTSISQSGIYNYMCCTSIFTRHLQRLLFNVI